MIRANQRTQRLRARLLSAAASVVVFALAGCHPTNMRATSPAHSTGGANATVPADGVYYCTEISSPFARWDCLGDVPADLARRRNQQVRVTIKGGRRVSEESVNGHGTLLPGWLSRSVYTHDAAGRLVGETVFDGFGVERERYTIAPDGTRTERRNAWGEPSTGPDEDDTWTVVISERDGLGRRLRARYQDGAGNPRTSDARVSEQRFGGYGDGSIVGDKTRFDAQGRPTDNEFGVHRNVNRWSRWGEVSARFFAPDGRPARAHDRWGLDQQLDVLGNVTRVDSVDPSGNIVNDERNGGRVVSTFDDHGDRIEERRFGPDGSPWEAGGGSLVRRVFDERGMAKVVVYLDAAGQPSKTGNFARKELVQDAAGAAIEERLFRADGRPGHHSLGDKQASTGWVYDDRHNLLEVRRYAADGSPGVDFEGTSITRRRYRHDKVIELEYRGVANELHAVHGVARVRYQRDATGMLVGRTFEDASGAIVKAYDYHAYGVGFAGARARRPSTRSKDEALARANALIADYAKTGSFFQAGAAYGDEPNAQPAVEQAGSVLWPELAAALERTPVGELTGVVETPGGFFVARRIR